MTTKEHFKKHDTEIAAIRKLVHTGMKMLVKNQTQINELLAAQKQTDASLKAFIDSMRSGGGNGHTKRQIS